MRHDSCLSALAGVLEARAGSAALVPYDRSFEDFGLEVKCGSFGLVVGGKSSFVALGEQEERAGIGVGNLV